MDEAVGVNRPLDNIQGPLTTLLRRGGGGAGDTDRGDRQEDHVINDVDCHDLVKTLAETCFKTGTPLFGTRLGNRFRAQLQAKSSDDLWIERMSEWLRLDQTEKAIAGFFRHKDAAIDTIVGQLIRRQDPVWMHDIVCLLECPPLGRRGP